MSSIIGIIVVFACVFGGFAVAGGHLGVVMKAMPFEMLIIGGAAVGAFIVSNNGPVIKSTLKSVKKVFSGTKWKKSDYTDALCLLFVLIRLMKSQGNMAVERHIEKPEESEIFKKYPKLLADHFVVSYICDTIRMMTMSFEDPHQVEDHMERLLEKHHEEDLESSSSLQTMADGLPALGIVAAVLGVIKTMGSISEPPEVLGKMIGSALVGTFLGVFLAYGLVGPFASKLKQVSNADAGLCKLIRDVLVGYLHGHAPQVAVEIGRANIPSDIQPSFFELEEAIRALPKTPTA